MTILSLVSKIPFLMNEKLLGLGFFGAFFLQIVRQSGLIINNGRVYLLSGQPSRTP